jgi:hypothetical protein
LTGDVEQHLKYQNQCVAVTMHLEINGDATSTRYEYLCSGMEIPCHRKEFKMLNKTIYCGPKQRNFNAIFKEVLD